MYDESCILVIKTSHDNRIKIAFIFSTYIALYIKPDSKTINAATEIAAAFIFKRLFKKHYI